MLKMVGNLGNKTSLYKLSLIRKNIQYEAVLGITNINYILLLDTINNFLSKEECRQFQLLPNEIAQESYLRSRFISKITAGIFTDTNDLTAIRIRHGIFNQPLLDNRSMISISHTGNYAASLVFSDEHPMGIDMELITADAPDKISSQLTREEIYLTKKLPEPENLSYTRCWTVKEALSKVLKTGLTIPMQLLEIDSVKACGLYVLSYFKHFGQYKSISYHEKNLMVSIVLPAETMLEIEKIK